MLAAALAILALASLALIPRPAQAGPGDVVWSATLTVQDILGGRILGCQTDVSGDSCTPALTDNDFSDDGTTYQVTFVQVQTRSLSFGLDKIFPADLINSHRLIVNGKPYHLATASVSGWVNTGDQLVWREHGQEWEAGDTVRLKLVERYFPTLTALNSNPYVQPRTASQRTPEGGSPSAGYCYTGDGTGTTEMIRYPDGRTAEVSKVGDTTRAMFACN